MDALYTHSFQVRWSDLDANGHLRNTGYVEYALQTRIAYFNDRGFPPSEFRRLQFGPVVFRDEVIYLKELLAMETVVVTMYFSALSDDGGRFTVHNLLYKGDEKAAEVISTGAWLDLTTRKLTAPPPHLAAIMRELYVET